MPSSHALSTNIYEIRPHGNENRYHYKIHPRKNGWLQNEPVHPGFFEPIQNSIKVITALQGAWTRFHHYCYHITTRCMEHPPLHLHYRLLATFKNCPNPFYMTGVHPFCRGNWRGSQNKMWRKPRQYRPLLREGTRYHGHPARMRSRIGARRIFILKIASERKETGHMKMLTWGLNLLIILMYLKFRQGFCKNRLVRANPDGSSRPRIVRRLARNQTQDFKSHIVRSTYGFQMNC